MPRFIDLPAPYGVTEFPDEATNDEIVQKYEELKRASAPAPAPPPAPRPSVSDYAQQVGGSVIRGLSKTVAALPAGAATLNRTLGWYQLHEPTDRALDYLSGLIKRTGEAVAPAEVPELRESFWASKVPQGVGSMAGFALPGGIASKVAKISPWLTTALAGSAVTGQDMYDDAKSKGADDETASLSSLVGNVIGTSEALPIAGMLNRLDRATGRTFLRTLFSIGGDTLEEALQNSGQQLAQNFTAQQLYDKDRELFDGFTEAAAGGGASALVASTLLNALGIPIRRAQDRSNLRRGEVRRRAVIREGIDSGELIPETKGTYADRTREGTRQQVEAGQAPTVVEEAQGGVQIRRPEIDRVEAEPGTSVVQPGFTTSGNAVQAPTVTGQMAEIVPEPVTPTATTIAGNVPQTIPAGAIAIRPDLMQFKRMDEADTGINQADTLAGQWDNYKAGNLLLWEPRNPAEYGLTGGQRYIVANGHHRFEFGTRAGVPGFSAQIVREADGISAADARSLAAEINIADGKGTIYDQVKFLRNESATHGQDAAVASAGRIGLKGRQASAIAFSATSDLYDAFVNEKVTPAQTTAIASAAPNNASAQQIGIKFALQGKSPDFVSNVIKASQAEAGQRAESLDLFGNDDAAMVQMAEQAERASAIQSDIRRTIQAISGAAKNPEIARREGVDLKNPAAVRARVDALKAELLRLENWPLHPDLVARVKDTNFRFSRVRRDTGTGDMFAAAAKPQAEPLVLAPPESVEEQRARLAAEEAARKAQAAQDQMAAQAAAPLTGGTGDLGQGDLLGGATDLFAPSRVVQMPATSIGVEAVRARLIQLGMQPGSMISVIDDPSQPFDARIEFSNGEPAGITLNAAAISSPEQVDRAIEHEAAHVVAESGAIGQLLSKLTESERAAISADMDRLGYATGSQEEFDARGVDALSQTFRGRNWFEKLVAYISSLFAKLGLRLSRLAAERAASRAVGRAVKESLTTAAGTAPVTQTFESRTPTTFETRQQVDLVVSDPLLTPAKIQVARDLAAVQSSLVNQETVDWIDAAPVSKADARAKPWLRYLKDRFEMSDMSALLRSMPETTDEQKQAKEVAGAAILNHYGTDRAVEAERLRDLEAKFVRRAEVGKRVAKMNEAQLKANFLEALFNRFTSDYRQYIVDQIAAAPASANIDSQFRQNLGVAERRLNDQQHSPGALQAALSAIATNIPTNLLTTGTTNQQIVDWAVQSGILVNVVGQDVRQWITVDAGNGVPALIGYARLLPDLTNLRELLLKREQVKKDLTDFEQWFSPTGKAKKVTPKELAKRYFDARTGRDKALAIAQAIEKEIDDLDTDIFANQIALDRLRALMTSPTYVSTVREAADKAHVVVRALYDTNGFRTGLIHRGGEAQGLSAGLLRMTGPIKGAEYLVELHPSQAQEFENVVRLKAFAAEAVEYAAANRDTDPLLSDSYLSLADEINKFYVHPALNPGTGFTQRPSLQIPGTTIRFGMDPSGILPKTLRSVLEKIGGRTAVQAVRDMNDLDRVMKAVDGINAHKEYGYAKQTEAVLAAIKSHKWSPDQFGRWDELIAERVLASGQNALSRPYEVGDIIFGTRGEKVTPEDMAALRLAKRWEDAIKREAPALIQDRIADLGVSRKAGGGGTFTMARTQNPWVADFLKSWDTIPADKENDPQRWALFDHENIFRRVILGYIAERNAEFGRMNAASPKATPFFKIFRKMMQQEEAGIQQFNSTAEVLDFMANEMVRADPSLDYPTALEKASEAMMGDITAFVKSFKDNVVGRKQDSVWGAVPDAVVQVATANNAFTLPRGELFAPSTFYSYSTGSTGRRDRHVGSLRSLLNLQVIQSMREAMAAMASAQKKLSDRATDFEAQGRSRGAAMKEMIRETQRSRKLNEIRYDYYELLDALSMVESVTAELERFEKSTAEHYQSPGIAAAMNVFGTLKSFLLSNPQAIATNYWSGVMLGPALIHLQTGRLGKAMVDFVWEPHMWGTMYRRLSAAVASNPIMSKLLNQHAPMWSWMARQITDAAEDWRKVEEIAVSSGMVSPYNVLSVIGNRRALKRTGGRLEGDEDLKQLKEYVAMVNTAFSVPGPAWVSEGARAFSPRIFDNFINYAQIVAFEYETDYLKKVGWAAFKAREAQAARTGNNWKDLSDPASVLQPADLRLKTHKALNRYRQLFSGLGSLDKVLLDFYERTKGMTKEQRAEEPLIPDLSDYSSIAIQYATTNLSTESNRPPLFKGKGTDGTWRNVAGTFMGWPINMARMMSTALETHSKDPQFFRIAHGMIGLALLVLLFSIGGAWNWEFGDELNKLIGNVSSARIQLGNVAAGAKEGELWTAALYMMQGFVNTAAFIGPAFGSMAGVAFTGRGNPFDVTSWNPVLGWVWDTWNTGKRIIQTGDATLPMWDYTRRWMPLSKIVLNRLPLMRGLVDQQNATRAMLGSAPRGTEIKWGRGGGSAAVRYGKQNDEIMKLIASAYEAVAHGGSEAEVYKRRQLAIDAYVKEGKSEEEATKSVNAALASKEPIRVLTGKEFASAEEEAKWVARMTPDQRKDYDRAVQAWNLLGSVTGRNMSFVAGEGGGGGGGRRSIPGLASALPSGIDIPSGLPSARSGLRLPSIGATAGSSLSSYTPRGLGGVRSIRRTRRTGSRRGLSSLRRRTTRIRQPRLASARRRSTRRRVRSVYA